MVAYLSEMHTVYLANTVHDAVTQHLLYKYQRVCWTKAPMQELPAPANIRDEKEVIATG